jgi:ribosome-associated protein
VIGLNVSTHTAQALASILESTLDDKKARDIVVIDLHGKSTMADAMIIATGFSSTHVRALAEQVMQRLQVAGCYPVAAEGMAEGEWVLIDNPYVIVHIFRPEIRAKYNLERLWEADLPEMAEIAYY